LPYMQLKDYPGDKEKQLFESVRSATDKEEIQHHVHDFYKSLLSNGPIDIHHIYELTIRLLAGLEKRMLVDSKPAASTEMKHPIMSIMRLETLREIETFVSDYIFALREEVLHSDKESHRSIIQKTILFMETECQNATLDSVARKVYMTPTYLSMLFKVNTGKTFIEQLTDIRMDKAKEMLRSTYMKNYEVAEKVGYRDSRYFSQIFKKKVGLSPSEYREAAIR
ncbi:MAG TPA: helix-turn-helix transcriptional regulator, partial [Anaerovoracaceae bacterium]|nr:helix-turn-helix transcriptional regulator [Anaerovoracaceae bacterium]